MRYLSLVLVLGLVSFVSFITTDDCHAESPEVIFNGKDLSGWTGRLANWSVIDGAITGKTSADNPIHENTFLVWDGEAANFVLTLQYKIQGGNSGIQYRSKVLDTEKFIVGGYQADIDSKKRFTGINYEEKGRGILVERGQIVSIAADGTKSATSTVENADELIALVKDGEWNRYKIIANGKTVQHFINDKLMSELQMGKLTRLQRLGRLPSKSTLASRWSLN